MQACCVYSSGGWNGDGDGGRGTGRSGEFWFLFMASLDVIFVGG